MRALVIGALMFSSQAYSATYPEDPVPLTTHAVDFNVSQASVNLGCYPKSEGVELIVPGDLVSGEAKALNRAIVYQDCDLSWSLIGQNLLLKDTGRFTRIRIRGRSNCTLKIAEPQAPQRTTLVRVYACE